MTSPTAKVVIEIEALPLPDLHRLLHPGGAVAAIADEPSAVHVPPMGTLEVCGKAIDQLKGELADSKRECRKLCDIIEQLKAEQPTWNGDAPKDRRSIDLPQHAPQDLLNLSVFLEKLDDGQLDTVWVAAVMDALRETLPGPSIRGLCNCLNLVRDRYRQRLTGEPATPVTTFERRGDTSDKPDGPLDGSACTEPPRQRAPKVMREELVQQMLAAVPNLGDKVKSTHFENQYRGRVQIIAIQDERFLWRPGVKPELGGPWTPGELERVA